MRYNFIITVLSLVILLSCHGEKDSKRSKGINNVDNVDTALTQSESVKVNATNLDISECDSEKSIFFDSICKQSPLRNISSLNIDKTWGDSIEGKYNQLDKMSIDYFYSTKELRDYHEFYHFQSYFFGRLNAINGLTPILILNSNWETATYLDCFLLDRSGVITDMFRLSFLELQPSYGYYGKGEFIADSVYKFLGISTEVIDFEKNVQTIDSIKIIYSIGIDGRITEKKTEYTKDTVRV